MRMPRTVYRKGLFGPGFMQQAIPKLKGSSEISETDANPVWWWPSRSYNEKFSLDERGYVLGTFTVSSPLVRATQL